MRSGRTFKVDAIVLKGRDYGEADRLLTLFSLEEGKIQAIARGVRKPRSKNRGAIQLYSRSEFLLYRGRGLATVCQCQLKKPLTSLVGSLSALAYAAYFAELTDGFQQELDANRGLFRLLNVTLDYLGQGGEERDQLLAVFFTVHLLALCGYRLQFQACSSCGRSLVAPVNLVPARGGAVCGDCTPREGGVPLSPAALATLRYLERSRVESLPRLNLPRLNRLEMERALHEAVIYYLEKRVKSLDFLQDVRALKGC